MTLVDAIRRIMDTPDEFTGPANLGNPAKLTIMGLAENIISLAGSRSRVAHKPLPKDAPTQRCPDISLARKHLDWEPRVPLAQGLTITYFDNLIRGNRSEQTIALADSV